jgi:NAD+ diphosphatase
LVFVPGITTTATAGRLYAITGQSLYVGADHAVPRGPAQGWLYLGLLDGEPCFAALDLAPPDTTATALRQLYGTLPEADFAVAGLALAVTAWDRDHRHCGRCATPTERSTTERARTCPACKLAAYPRLSPAVIVAVERDGKLLLARNARTRMPFHSVLAGFVEVGESLEDTVARELAEEAGVTVTDIRYFGSQPWPFTSSMMVGFTARWASGEIRADLDEIFEAGWFAPAELPIVPGKLSIARALIDDFVRRHT